MEILNIYSNWNFMDSHHSLLDELSITIFIANINCAILFIKELYSFYIFI